MKHFFAVACAAALAVFPLPGLAETEAPTAEFRSPADMTVEERRSIMESVTTYNVCMHEAALKAVEGVEDIRNAADSALGSCRGKLDELGGKITGYKFDPGFARQFTTQIRNNAVHNLLPELAQKKSGG